MVTTGGVSAVPLNGTRWVTLEGYHLDQSHTIELVPQSSGDAAYTGGVNIISPNEIELEFHGGTVADIYNLLYRGVCGDVELEGRVEGRNLQILVPGSNTPWVRVSSSISASNGAMEPAQNVSGWSKGASFGTVPAGTDFRLEFRFAGGVNGQTQWWGMFGMDASDPNFSYTTIDYAIYLYYSGTRIYENGSYRGQFGGAAAIGDVFEVVRTGTVVTYKKNGAVFYTSTVPSSAAMVFDSSIYRNATIDNISLEF